MVIEKVGGDGELVEYVSFVVLNKEQDAQGKRWIVLRVAVGFMGSSKARA